MWSVKRQDTYLSVQQPIWGAVNVLVVVALFASSPSAYGHGTRPLAITGLASAPNLQPGAAAAPWLGAMTSGAIVSDDGGHTFRWICEGALAGPVADDLAIGVTGDGRMLVGGEHVGLLLSDDGGCSFNASGNFLPPQTFAALALSPRQTKSWYVAANAISDGHGSVWHTEDAGLHYRRLGFAAPGVYLTGLATLDDTLVAVGTNNRARDSAQLFVSRDGGSNWLGGAVPGAPPMCGEVRVWALPHGRLAVAALDGTNNASTVLLGTASPGGLQVAYAMGQPVRQVASDDTGNVLLISGTTHVARSTDAGASFTVPPHPAAGGCAAQLGQQLLTCGDAAMGDNFAIAAFVDTSEVVRPTFRFTELVGPYACPDSTPVGSICTEAWPQVAQRFGASAAAPKNLAAARGVAKESQRSGCVAGGPGRSTDGLGGLVAALVTWRVLRPLRGHGIIKRRRLAPVRVSRRRRQR